MTAVIRRARESAAPLSDAELLASIAHDDLHALGVLFDRHHRRIERVLLRTGTAAADVDDIVQATFLEIPKIARGFDGRDSCVGWLCGVAVRLAARRRRSMMRLLRTLLSFGAEAPREFTIDPEADASAREEMALFAGALARLAPKKREAFVLVEVEGFSAEEVARSLGVNAATVRTRLFHARAELRTAMAKEEVRR
jgi:RNA polymerase sigma-70 factor (ECF subfamily)